MIRKLTLSSILLYYDVPQIFVSKDAVGTNYICLLIELGEVTSKYISTPISNNRLTMFVSGLLDLREIFTKTEIGIYYYLDLEGENIVIEKESIEELHENMLPDPGFFMTTKRDDKIIISETLSRNNAVVHLSLSDDEDSNSISADDLGIVLKLYQQILENSYKKVVSSSKSPRKKALIRPENYKMRAFASSQGSFNLHLFSTSEIDMFGNTRIELALLKFDELLDSGRHTNNELFKVYKSMQGHAISSLKQFLAKVIELDISIKHKWFAPNQNSVRYTSITRENAVRITEILNSSEELSNEEKDFTGFFEQIDTKNGTWRIRNNEDNTVYSGFTKSPGQLEGLTTISIQYKITCIETIDVLNVSEKENRRLELISVYLVS